MIRNLYGLIEQAKYNAALKSDRVPIVPKGANASNIQQWTVGKPTTFYQLRIIKYY